MAATRDSRFTRRSSRAPSGLVLCLVGSGALLASAGACAGDPEKGKALSAVCVACHGVAGISPNPQWPNLAGQKEQYLVIAMKAYRDGDRQDPLMAPISAGLSDEEIADLAAYYAGL